MRLFCLFLLLQLLSISALIAGKQERAGLLVRVYQSEKSTWMNKLKKAKTLQERRALWAEKPDSLTMGKQLWQEIASSLREDWVLDYANVLLEEAPRFSNMKLNSNSKNSASPASLLLQAASIHHFDNPKLGRFCLSLTVVPSPITVKFLERILEKHPDRKVKGQAAIALSMLLSDLGDDVKVIRRRLTLLKQSITDATEVKIGKTTVGALAEEELYKITNLSRGQKAPNLKGMNLSGKPMSMEEFQNQTIVLFFWNAQMEKAEDSIRYMQKLHKKLEGKKVTILGVATESTSILRKLERNKQLPWKNWIDSLGQLAHVYRVRKWPSVFVLDPKGQIQYQGAADSFVEIAVQAQLEKSLQK